MAENPRHPLLTHRGCRGQLVPPLSRNSLRTSPLLGYGSPADLTFSDWFSDTPDYGGFEIAAEPKATRDDEDMRDVSVDGVVQPQDTAVDGDTEMGGIEELNTTDSELFATVNDDPAMPEVNISKSSPAAMTELGSTSQEQASMKTSRSDSSATASIQLETANKDSVSSEVNSSNPSTAAMEELYPDFAAAIETRYCHFNPNVYAPVGNTNSAGINQTFHPALSGHVQERYGDLDPNIYSVPNEARKSGVAIEKYPVFAAAPVADRYCEYNPDASSLLGHPQQSSLEDPVLIDRNTAPINDIASNETTVIVENAGNPHVVEDAEDLVGDCRFTSALEDLQCSLKSRTSDARLFNQQRFVDNDGNFHGYNEFPAEKVIHNPYTTISTSPRQSARAPDLNAKYPSVKAPYVDISYIPDAPADILRTLCRMSQDSCRTLAPNPFWQTFDGTSDEPPLDQHSERGRYLSPMSRRTSNSSVCVRARFPAPAPVEEMLRSFFETCDVIGVVDQNHFYGQAYYVMVDGYLKGPFTQLQGAQLGLPMDNSEFINAGRQHLKQMLDGSQSQNESSGAPLAPEVQEWLQSQYQAKKDAGAKDSGEVSEPSYSGCYKSQERELFGVEPLPEMTVSGEDLVPLASSGDDPSTLCFRRSPSPPLPLNVRHGKRSRVVHHEMTDQEFNRLLYVFDHAENKHISVLMGGITSEDVDMDYDIASGDTTDCDDEQYFRSDEAQNTPLQQAQSNGAPYGRGKLPALSLFTVSAASDTGTSGQHAATTSTTNYVSDSVNAQLGYQTPMPSAPTQQPPTPDRRPLPAGIMQVEGSSRESNFIVYSPGAAFNPVRVTPRRLRSGRVRSIAPAPAPISTSSFAPTVVPVLAQNYASGGPGLDSATPVHSSNFAATVTTATNFTTPQHLSAIPVFTTDRPRDRSASAAYGTVTSTANFQAHHPQGFSRYNSQGQGVATNFTTPRSNHRGHRAPRRGHQTGSEYGVTGGTTGHGANGGYGHQGEHSEIIGHGTPSGQLHQGEFGGYHQDRARVNTINSFAPPPPTNYQHGHWQETSAGSNQPWNLQIGTSSSAHGSHGTESMTPSANFSPLASYDPPTPTPLFRAGHNLPSHPMYASYANNLPFIPARAESAVLPMNHRYHRRSANFLNPSPEGQCSEAAIPFQKPQPSTTYTNRPREIASVKFVNAQTRDMCVAMFEKEKMNSEKGRQLIVSENMDGSNILVVSGSAGSNVRGYVQELFGPNVEISVSLS